MKKKATQMTDETQVTETKTDGRKQRKDFKKGPQKVWVLVTVRDAEGNEIDMRKNKSVFTTEIALSKDSEGVAQLLLEGSGTPFVQQVEIPKLAKEEEETAETE